MATVALLVGMLALLSLYNTSQIYAQHHGLYNHPLQVRRAIGDIKAAILTIHRDMKDVVLMPTGSVEASHILASMEQQKAAVFDQIAVLYDRYLGPRSDVDALRQSYIKWNAIRDETLRIWRSGNSQAAIARTQRHGEGGAMVIQLLQEIDAISDFAHRRADQFYQEATQLYRAMQLQLLLLGALTLIAAISLFTLIIRAVNAPLEALTNATNRIASGELHARSEYTGNNEFGALSIAFNRMAEAIERQWRLSELQNTLAQALMRDEELQAFAREALTTLIRLTGADAGALYLVDDARREMEPVESIGLPREHRRTYALSEYEGLFGLSLSTLQPQRIRQIPEDARFVLHSPHGAWMPREIFVIPVLSGGRVEAVVSLAAIQAFSDEAWDFIHQSLSLLTARVSGVLAHRRIHVFAEQLERQNRELESQQRLVLHQTREMSEQNRELEAQARQLEEANRLKSAFLSNMSHELRTPLNSVIALSGVLRRRLHGRVEPDDYEYLEVIERNGKNLLALINDILDLSRVESGREEITHTVFALSDVMEEITQSLRPTAEEKGITIQSHTGANVPALYTDHAKVRQILLNLAANAVKFTEQGSVTLRAYVDGQTICVDVEDTGIGIPADQQERIFDEFRQADDGASRRYGGTGLGLTIARKYARLLGGDILVSSEPGRGSVFTLWLPLQDPVAANPSQPSTPGPTPLDELPKRTPNEPIRLIIVDDNPAAVVQLTDILAPEGYQITTCTDGHEALEKIKLMHPHGIILDLMMPEVDGFAVLEALKGDPDTRHIPVLILTARQVSRKDLKRLMSNHVFQLVQKGDIDRAGLIRSVSRMTGDDGFSQAAKPVDTKAKVKVLVVEDNPDNLHTARALLSDRYEVYEAMDGAACLQVAAEIEPDIILMDIAMPVMDGVTAYLHLRDHPKLHMIPVIAVTASAMPEEREAILAHGFSDFLAKPVDADSLYSAIERALRETKHE